MKERTCKMCKSPFRGRSDKQYCSVACKSTYHYRLRQVTDSATYATDAILHRNRSILLEVMGKHSKQKTIESVVLEKKKFRFNFMTGYYENARGKRYHIVYDFAWMKFSDGRILIIRRSK